ncbi:MAG: VOC family protein [Rubrobacteraceae bacterium]
MGKRENYEPGTFCWLDLSTSDLDGAKSFYGGLFDWEFEDTEMPGGDIYTMCKLQGDEVAAIVQQDQQPGHWNHYVGVENADETAAMAKELGASVFEEPFDVMEAGRMAVFADPSGAVLCVWETWDHMGAGRVNDVGCMAWNELQTRELEKATDFYSALFGWETDPIEEDGQTAYVTIKNRSGWMNGGMMPMTGQPDEMPSHWLPYFSVTSCDEAAEKAESLGGALLAGPMEPGAGRIAVLSDPQGSAFAVFEGETDE